MGLSKSGSTSQPLTQVLDDSRQFRPQIVMAKRLLDEGKQAWTSISGNNDHVPWEALVLRINGHFMKISRSTRSLTDQDLECLRRIACCQDFVSLENFERLWYWLCPVAFNLSKKKTLTVMWGSLSPLWIEGFISKEDAEFNLHCQGGLQDPGTFVLRFPTSRSWPHPDAGNLVVTYVVEGNFPSFYIHIIDSFFPRRNAATSKYATSRA